MAKIIAIDIDGVLAEYPTAWLEYVNHKAGKDFKNLHQAKNELSFSEYNHFKEQYRLSGIKRHIPSMHGARELTEHFRAKGYLIVVLTARPFLKYPKLFEDTIFWLKNNHIQYDLIFWGKDKHHQIIKYFPTCKFMIEDNHTLANKIADHGYKVYLLNNSYNHGFIGSNVIRINKLSEVIEHEN